MNLPSIWGWTIEVKRRVPVLNLADYRAGNLEVSRCHYQYGNLADYPTGNLSKCHDVITGMVTWPITILVMIQSVTMVLLVR
jgi:hypothetical protein